MLRAKDQIRPHLLVIGFLVALTLMPYVQVRGHAFVDLDDYDYIVDNPNVKYGFSAEGVLWALGFRDQDRSYWRPLTWLTHMLDFELFGKDAGAHHLVNLLIHLLNVLLLYGFLFKTTANRGCSAAVAVLFAVHPINVESVAWVTERSNLLSTGLGLLTLIQYADYTRNPSRRRYLSTLMVFLLCLMAKPILVTLPFLMLLLDYWPLNRMHLGARVKDDGTGHGRAVRRIGRLVAEDDRPGGLRRLVVEKLPFLALALGAIAFSVVRFGTTIPVEHVPLALRVANAIVSYIKYLAHLFFPFGLAAFYPFPTSVPAWQVASSILLLVTISLLLVMQMRRRGFLLIGWLWFLGTLVPKIGLVQAGLWPELADRWAYFPAIGIFIVVVWGAAAAGSRWPDGVRRTALSAALLVVGLLMAATWRQAGYWSNSTLLFKRMLAETSNNYMAHNNMGFVLMEAKQWGRAAEHFSRAIAIKPNFEVPYLNLGLVAKANRAYDEAIRWYEKAIAVNPNYAQAYLNLGNVYFQKGAMRDAIRCYARGVEADPHSSLLNNSLGAALARIGRLEDAVAYFKAALRIDPGLKVAAKNLKAVEAALARRSRN